MIERTLKKEKIVSEERTDLVWDIQMVKITVASGLISLDSIFLKIGDFYKKITVA